MDFAGLSGAQNQVILALKVLTLAGVVALAWRRRKLGGLDFLTTLGAAFTWIFVFMPGAGVQYMVWYAPFVLLLSARWWAGLTAGSVIYMARFYHSTSQFHFPWMMALPKGTEVALLGPMDQSRLGRLHPAPHLPRRIVVHDREAGEHGRGSGGKGGRGGLKGLAEGPQINTDLRRF